MLSSQRPEVSRFWISRRFRAWSGHVDWWTDLATRTVRSAGEGERALPAAPTGIDGLVYVPPVASELARHRQRLVGELTAMGATVLLQLQAGDVAIDGPGVECVYDLLPSLLGDSLDALGEPAPCATAVWPLIPGLSDQTSRWREGCRLLAGAGVACVQAMAPILEGRVRRALASELEKRDSTLFQAIFHGRTPSERAFASVADQFGLCPFYARPLVDDGSRQYRNRRIAELLGVGAETWLGLDRTESIGQNLFRAARWAEETSIDVRALALEGNLEILEWLVEPAASIVKEWSDKGSSATLESLVREYLKAV